MLTVKVGDACRGQAASGEAAGAVMGGDDPRERWGQRVCVLQSVLREVS